MKDMPSIFKFGKRRLISFHFVTLTGTANFVACSLKALGYSYGYALRAFPEHSLKI